MVKLTGLEAWNRLITLARSQEMATTRPIEHEFYEEGAFGKEVRPRAPNEGVARAEGLNPLSQPAPSCNGPAEAVVPATMAEAVQ